jgi:hypothetical protein
MKATIAAVAIASALLVAPASARDRDVGNALLGTGAGLIVFGPVGAVAGAAVGYTAGEGIARSWGIRRPPRKVRKPANR